MTLKPSVVILALVGMLLFPLHGVAQVANPGFELADEKNPQMPRNWRIVGNGGTLSLDESQKHAGERSVRIVKAAGATFTGIGQVIDAVPWRGKTIVLSAQLRAENFRGGMATVWLRADAGGKSVDFTSTPFHPTNGSSDWTERAAIVEVSDTADKIVFGATLSADGILWVDSVDLAELDASKLKPVSADAMKYLDEAISKIRENALFQARVDWGKARLRAQAIASGATTPADTYGAISYLLRSLNDGHSFLKSAAEARELTDNARTDDFGIESSLLMEKGYIRVPAYAGINPKRSIAFADEIQDRISALVQSKPCGWIVDLRSDGGGNMYPMIAGLAPLLGDGDLGYFARGESRIAWYLKDGGAGPYGTAGPLHSSRPSFLVDGGRPWLAILTGPKTASSGEALAVSFRGRPNARSFGQATAGQSTANTNISLSDGAMMLITTAVFADATGRLYGAAIAPDEIVEPGPTDAPLSEDPTIEAASHWLDERPRCKTPRG
jgi:carboxyl-terminal processing protease